MNLVDALNKVRKSRLYPYWLILIPPLYLFEVWLWIQVMLAVIVMIPLGLFALPYLTFPVEIKGGPEIAE